MQLPRLSLLLPIIASVSGALPAHADTGTKWNGTYWGLSLRTGLGLRAADTSTLTPSIGLSLRASQIMNFFEAELFFDYGLPDNTFTRSRLGADFRLRPFFMSYLQNVYLKDVLGSFYLSLGLGADFGSAGDLSESAFAFSLGAGLDLPLSNPRQNDPSFALSLGYRLRFAGFDEFPEGLGNGDEHLFLLTFGIRFNGLTFAHLPNPSELKDHGRTL